MPFLPGLRQGRRDVTDRRVARVVAPPPRVPALLAGAGASTEVGSAWGGATDPYFGAPLWLQGPCCGGRVLWAYNERHLSVLRAHVAARLRERPPDGLGPTSMLERLPSWITSAQHREEVVRTIDRLQRRVPPHDRRAAARPRRRPT